MENKTIPDGRLTSSSVLNSGTPAKNDTLQGVHGALQKVSKATLGLPSKLLRSGAGEIAPSLCRMFNMSLAQGIFQRGGKTPI